MRVVKIINYKVVGVYNWQTIPPEVVGDLTYTILNENEQGVDMGWDYLGGEFFPPADTSSTFGRIITVLAYRRRFSQAERVAIKMASRGQIDGVTPQIAAAVACDLDDLGVAGYIHLDRVDTVSGTLALETLGLLAVGRASAVRAPPVYSTELPAEIRRGYGLPAIPTDKEYLNNSGKGYLTVNEFFEDNKPT